MRRVAGGADDRAMEESPVNDSKRMLRRLTMSAVAFSLVLAACSTPGAGGSGEAKGTVNLAINPWVGYEADAAIVAYLLEKELGYTVASFPPCEARGRRGEMINGD